MVSIADHSHFHLLQSHINGSQKILSIPQLNQILRRGDVVFSPPS